MRNIDPDTEENQKASRANEAEVFALQQMAKRPDLNPCPRCGDDSPANWLDWDVPEGTGGSFVCDACGWEAAYGRSKLEAANYWDIGLEDIG